MKTCRLAMIGSGGALALTLLGATSAQAAESYQVELEQLNNSGASGTAMLMVDGNNLTVQITATGLVPNAPHAQHLHGDADMSKDYMCPPNDLSRDADGNGTVTTTEAVPDYGGVFYSLTTEGDTSADSGLAVDRFPTADASGNLSYERTFEVDDATVAAIKNLHIVQHGVDKNGNGTYDVEGAGASDLDPALPEEATTPANCGMVMGAAVTQMPEGGVQTGGGDTGGTEQAGLIGAGALALAAAAAGGVVALRRRTGQAGA